MGTNTNISRYIGIPATRQRGLEQHKELIQKLKNEEMFGIQRLNHGYLTLMEEDEKMLQGVVAPKGKPFHTYPNHLFKTAPTGRRVIKVTKV